MLVSIPGLLAEIQLAFSASVPLAGGATGAGPALAGALPSRAGEVARAWLPPPAEAVRASWANRATLPVADFVQYLPAWLCSALPPVKNSPLDIASLLELLRLPTELPAPTKGNAGELAAQLQEQLTLTNQALRTFISRMGQLTPAQGRAVYHFLAYLRDSSGEPNWSQVADAALQRYWFRYR